MHDDAKSFPNATAPEANVTGARIAAGLIDVALLAVVFVVMALVFGDHDVGADRGLDGAQTNANFNLTGWPFAAYLAIVAGYYLVSELLLRTTFGKLILGLRVASSDERPLSAGRIMVRNALRIVDALPFLYLVGLVTVAASKRQQRIGDMVASTIVVRARKD